MNNKLYSRIALCLLCTSQFQACVSSRWYSVQQQPAEPFANISDSVFVSNDYVRAATIHEIDGNLVVKSANKNIKIDTGRHQVNILCDEAQGTYDSEVLRGQAKVLEFEANIQRNYKVFCQPFTHWWIEDLENGNVVAGEKPAS